MFSRTRLVPGIDSRRTNDSAPFNVFTVARTLEPVSATGELRVLPHFDFGTTPVIDLLVIPSQGDQGDQGVGISPRSP